ncbi:MAG: cysteine--tRNA ligase [Oligoflexia bacterium]|nr:cysteine--tRNA ligase [Oligoflexia bacterium]
MNMNNVTIYSTLTRKKERLNPITDGEIKFYSCGPTTYDFLHVGNGRALVVGDLIHRILKSLGYKVTFVRNFTDVDDKIINRAKEKGVPALEHADIFVNECKKDMHSLMMIDPTFTPKVSETIPEIIEMIERLIAKGFAYVVNGEVLYHVPRFESYGKLSKKDLEKLQHGIRVEVDDYKKHPSDFVLWKPAKGGEEEPSWDSPWGKGRPGWHIECSAMSYKFLGPAIDIHHGGIDLIFPHHENEIAQSEAANGVNFCSYWCHNEFVNFGTEKMSKSLGNVVTIRNFIEKFGGIVLRYIFVSSHYRTKLDWSDKIIQKSIEELERIHQFVIEFEQININISKDNNNNSSSSSSNNVLEKIKQELANDFNTPKALAHFFTLIRDFRRERDEKDHKDHASFSAQALSEIKEIIDFVNNSMGIIHPNPASLLNELNHAKRELTATAANATTAAVNSIDEQEIQKMIDERNLAKKEKNWAKADEIRNTLKQNKIILKDSPDGKTTWSYEP